MERTHRHLFQSLPPYLGGKRGLARAIFEDCASLIAPGKWADSTFLDVFSGGGAVSLTAKALGFTVHCNDLAERAAIVGHALIANGEVHLSRSDLIPLFGGLPDPAIEQAALRFLPEAHARFLAGAIPAARACSGPKQWLLLLVLLKWVLHLLPMSSPAATDARRAAQLDLDGISPKRVGQYLRARQLLLPSVLWGIAQQVNAGVMPGRGTVSQLDAVEFLQSHDGDIAYLDPPYPGTTSYEVEYRLLDVLFGGAAIPRSRYSSAAPPLDALLTAADHLPAWVISFGGRNPEAMVDLVRQRRPNTSVRRLPYRHLAALSRRSTHEYLIVARR